MLFKENNNKRKQLKHFQISVIPVHEMMIKIILWDHLNWNHKRISAKFIYKSMNMINKI